MATSATAASAVDARARDLRECATRRWLVKDELVFLLLHEQEQTAVPCLHTLQSRPPSGTLLFYDTTQVADFKKDGWRWQKRKDNSGRVREDRAKLVINREVIILGTYVHSAEIPTFHRRNYYLRDSNQNVMLVHYFDEVNKTDPSMGALVPPKSQPLPRNVASIPPMALAVTTPPMGGEKTTLPFLKTTAQPPTTLLFSPFPALKMDPDNDAHHSSDVIMTECFAIDNDQAYYANQTGDSSTSQLFPSFEDDETLLSDLSSLLSPIASSTSHNGAVGVNTPLSVSLVEISDFSPGWDFVEGGAKILLCLASPIVLPDSSNSGDIYVQFGDLSRTPAERISDTVLRCAAPRAIFAGAVDLFVCRCSSATSSDCVPISTSRRFEYKNIHTSPAPAPMLVREDVMAQVNALPDIHTNGASSGGKRGRSPGPESRLHHSGPKPPDGRRWSNPDCSNLSAFVDTGLDERQCKIRVVERLAEFQDAIRTTATSSVHDTQNEQQLISSTDQKSMNEHGTLNVVDTSIPNSALDDGVIEALSDQDLESLSEQLIENVVRQLVTVAHTSDELLDELNSLDETGLSLLHYVSFYNYSHLIPLLLSHGAQVNQQSTQGQTPLHLAAGCGHEQVIVKLLEAGAEVFSLDFDGFTPAERAEKSGHVEVAQRLRKCMGESSDGHGSFETEITHDSVWDDSMEDMDIDGESSGFGSLHSSQERYSLTTETTSVEGEADGGFDHHGSISSSRTASYVGENQEHNRKLLLGAFSTMSLHDKCALSLSISRDLASSSNTNAKRRGSSISEEGVAAFMAGGSSSASSPSKGTEVLGITAPACATSSENEPMRDTGVKSVIADNEENLNKLEAAMELMGPDEIQSLEEEARVIQHNVRAWLLRRNCRNMRETTKRLHEAAKSIEDQQKQQEEQRMQEVERHFMSQQELSERERAAVTVQAAARSMLARKSFLQTRNVTIKVQAATRGVLCRNNFARMKTHALASLVIQRNVREWLSKQPPGGPSADTDNGHTAPGIATVSPSIVHQESERDDDKHELLDDDDAALVHELNAVFDAPAMDPFLAP